MADPIKRLRYFDEQFLRASDFNDSEAYHLGMRRRHNRLLHTPGVADGLAVAAASATSVSVSPGTALDGQGREIALEDPKDVDLAGLAADAPAYVVVSFAEKPTDPSDETGVLDDTRWTEEPKLEALDAAPADATQVLLAKVTRAGQNVQSVDDSVRVRAGVREAATKVNRSGDHVTGDLTVAGSLGVGTPAPNARLQVSGGAIMPAAGDSASAGIQFPSDPGGGAGDEAFIRYFAEAGETTTFVLGCGNDADDRIELQQAGDKRLSVHNGNVGIGTRTPANKLDVAGDIAISGRHAIRGDDSWLRLNQDAAFTSGVHTPGLLGPVSLNVGGIGGWGNPGSGNAWFSGSVGIGTTALPARLTVAGGDIQLDNARTLRSTGRLHIRAEELLYLLAANGVHITQDMGGTGALHVSNSVYINGFGPGDRTTGGEGLICWDVEAKGGVYSQSKQFMIDHPLRPATHHLLHSCIEGPEHAVFYRGEGHLVGGMARIELPEYFEALTHNGGRTVMVTPILGADGAFSPLAASAVTDGAFTVHAAPDGDGEQAFWWEVKATRADLSALTTERVKDSVPEGTPA